MILFQDGEILSRGPPEEVLDGKESSGKEKDTQPQQENQVRFVVISCHQIDFTYWVLFIRIIQLSWI